MTVRHLKIFIAVVECGSMNAAARMLFLSQPTVSQAIRELEEYYETELFDRIGKRVYITASGKDLLVHARKAVDQFEVLESHMKKNGHRTSLRIGATITVGSYLLTDILEDCKELIPEVDVYAYVGNTADIEKKLLHSELDVALVEGKIHHSELLSFPVIEDYLVLACAQDHPFAGLSEISARDLSGQSFAQREIGSGTRALFDEYAQRNAIQVNTSIEAANPEVLKQAVIYNHNLAVMSIRLLENELQNGSIHAFLPDNHEFTRNFSLVYHADKLLTPAINKLFEIIDLYRQPNYLEEFSIGVIRPAEPVSLQQINA